MFLFSLRFSAGFRTSVSKHNNKHSTVHSGPIWICLQSQRGAGDCLRACKPTNKPHDSLQPQTCNRDESQTGSVWRNWKLARRFRSILFLTFQHSTYKLLSLQVTIELRYNMILFLSRSYYLVSILFTQEKNDLVHTHYFILFIYIFWSCSHKVSSFSHLLFCLCKLLSCYHLYTKS